MMRSVVEFCGSQYSLVLFQSFLVSWTKGFKSSGVEGKDVVTLIRKAIQRRGVSRAAEMGRQELGVWRLFTFFWVHSEVFPCLSSNQHENLLWFLMRSFLFFFSAMLPNNLYFFQFY